MKLPPKYAALIQGLCISTGMSFFMSLALVALRTGFADGFVIQWLEAWFIGLLIAIPVSAAIVPPAKKLAARITKEPELGEGAAMREIKRINHVGIRVRDLATTRNFYEKLGFDFIVGPVGPEPVAIMEHPSGVNINFILNTSDDASPNNLLMDVQEKHTGYTHMAMEITDAESVERQLNDLGVPITETVKFGGAVFFFVRDPDGNVIEFHKPASS